MSHKLEEAVRAYLLGTLNSRDAAEMERQYFADPEFLGRLRTAEVRLVEDYLGNRLPAGQKTLFTSRYLDSPGRAGIVDEVRAKLVTPPVEVTRRSFGGWRLAVASALLVLAFGAGYVYRQTRSRGGISAGPPPISNAPAVLTLRLFPGVLKGPGAQSTSLPAPTAGSIVRLVLDLPGQSAGSAYRARLLSIDAEGGRGLAWASGALNSTSAPGGSLLNVDVPAAVLLPGDYLVEAVAPVRGPLASYLFHVSAAQ